MRINISWPIAIVLFFGVVFAVNALLVIFAMKNQTDVIEDSPYEKGLAYETEIQEQRNAKELSWKPELEFGELTNDGFRSISSKISKELIGKINKFTVNAKRTEGRQYDVQVNLDPTGELQDIYFGEIAMAKSGLWLVEIVVGIEDKTYRWDKKITL